MIVFVHYDEKFERETSENSIQTDGCILFRLVNWLLVTKRPQSNISFMFRTGEFFRRFKISVCIFRQNRIVFQRKRRLYTNCVSQVTSVKCYNHFFHSEKNV